MPHERTNFFDKRNGKIALIMYSRYANAKQFKRARRQLKKLKTYLGRVRREIERKIKNPDVELQYLLSISQQVATQGKTDSNKIYSIHEPTVECIAKGKAHKKYEFGCKVSVVTANKTNWILGIQAVRGRPFDGHTLPGAIEQAERITGIRIEETYVDKGYQGAKKLLPERKSI